MTEKENMTFTTEGKLSLAIANLLVTVVGIQG
jgi:hypothetical protein